MESIVTLFFKVIKKTQQIVFAGPVLLKQFDQFLCLFFSRFYIDFIVRNPCKNSVG